MPEEIELNVNNPKDAVVYVSLIANKVPLSMQDNSMLRQAQKTLNAYFTMKPKVTDTDTDTGADTDTDTEPKIDEPGDTDDSRD